MGLLQKCLENLEESASQEFRQAALTESGFPQKEPFIKQSKESFSFEIVRNRLHVIQKNRLLYVDMQRVKLIQLVSLHW